MAKQVAVRLTRMLDEAGAEASSLKAIFVFMVCNEFRKQFNVPLESLAWLKNFMM